ncbi:hypothetical protein FRB99_002863 [Tulasnella sp. 403]|nr:hypothetical protein FRB99_002863 [Tulasnella sp. 403]
MSTTTSHQEFEDASRGFDWLFGDDIEKAKEVLGAGTSPFHHLGLGTVIFLQAALGLEHGIMADAAKVLAQAETKTKEALRNQPRKSATKYPAGMEYEVLQADAVILLGLTQALSESYSGYLKCLYSLNSAHGSFTKIYKRVFPNGLEGYPTVASLASTSSSLAASANSTPIPSRPASSVNLAVTPATTSSASSTSSRGFFSRLTGSSAASSASGASTPVIEPDGALEELIVYGAAFGFGLFNLVFSMLPAGVRRVVGIFGFHSDRKLALQALSVAAAGKGIKLLMAGYLANEGELLRQLGVMLDSLEARYPHGSLWLLNRAKLQRYNNDPDAAIATLQRGLGSSRPVKFVQADALLVFELSWDLLVQRRYEESAETWLRMTKLNTWSHATYTYLAAGCYLALGTPEGTTKAKALLDTLPSLLASNRKMGGKDLPTEVFIQRRVSFWKTKSERWTNEGRKGITHYIDCVRVNPAEELAIFWNTHGRIPKSTAIAHIHDFLALTPPVDVDTPFKSEEEKESAEGVDLDTPDEICSRNLLLGITHRAAQSYTHSRTFLLAAIPSSTQPVSDGSKWLTSMAYFELAVLDMVEAPSDADKERWEHAIEEAGKHLDKATANLGDADLSSRLESRIAMLRDELELKKSMLA